MRDVGRAAKDWPKINFIIYHGGYHFAGGGKVEDAWAQFEKTGRIEWVTDLAEIPSKFGVSNVYADVGQLFAQTTIAEPRVSAAMMGMLVRGLGADHVVWGTDAIWTGSPQWQIEALRRLEIPEDMQKQHGFKPLGAADGPIKSAIFGETNARLYKYERRAALATDRFAASRRSTRPPAASGAICATVTWRRRGADGARLPGPSAASEVRGVEIREPAARQHEARERDPLLDHEAAREVRGAREGCRRLRFAAVATPLEHEREHHGADGDHRRRGRPAQQAADEPERRQLE